NDGGGVRAKRGGGPQELPAAPGDAGGRRLQEGRSAGLRRRDGPPPGAQCGRGAGQPLPQQRFPGLCDHALAKRRAYRSSVDRRLVRTGQIGPLKRKAGNVRLLVVEDDKTLNLQIVTALEQAGYAVDTAF